MCKQVLFTIILALMVASVVSAGPDQVDLSQDDLVPTILVEAGGDIAAANAGAAAGDIIGIAAGTFAITEAIEIKDGVTYLGAGSGQTIIDCGGVTRAFVGWGDRSMNDALAYSEEGYPVNTTGPKGWVIQGMSIINGVADDVDKSVLRAGDPAVDPPLTENVITDALKSTNGGGILLENYAEGTLIDVAFENCSALATGVDTADPALAATYLGSGGAVHMGWATANIVDCSFTGNKASNDGGAINATNPDLMNWDLSIENSTFTSNSCRDDGGAISSTRRNLSVINCVGDGNKTGLDPAIMADNASDSASGGFLYLTGAGKVNGTSYTDDTPDLEMTNYGGVVNVSDCTITNGEAVQRGGGIRCNGAAQLIITDTSFINCIALTDDGGAIFANSISPFNPDALEPGNPDAPVGVPGIYLDNVTIDGCSAADDGGGFKVDNYRPDSTTNYIEFPKVAINNSIIKNCRAGGPAPDDGNRDGGGILVNNKLNLTITNTLIDNCTAGRHAAGIKIDGIVNAALIDGCQISNCINDDIGGEGGDGVAIYADSDENVNVMISNCIFNNNTNMQDDGVFRIDAHEAFFFNCTFVGNVTADQGIIRFATSEDDPSVRNGVVNCLFVNNDHSPGSDELIAHNKNNVTYTYTHNGFFGNVGDGDELIDTIPDEDLGLTANFITSTDPLVDSAAVGGDYHLAPGAEAIDAGIATGAPDHDFDNVPRPQGAAHDVGAYESSDAGGTLVLDNFEQYTDVYPIWDVWADGYYEDDNGSVVGTDFAPGTVQGTMPVFYDNTGTAVYSEVTRSYDPPQNWSQLGFNSIGISFKGEPENTPGQLYIRINDQDDVPYEGPSADMQNVMWHMFNAAFDLTSVQSVTIGVKSGGKGMLYIDNVELGNL